MLKLFSALRTPGLSTVSCDHNAAVESDAKRCQTLAEDLADVGVVKIWIRLENLTAFLSRPNHKRVHWSLDVIAR